MQNKNLLLIGAFVVLAAVLLFLYGNGATDVGNSQEQAEETTLTDSPESMTDGNTTGDDTLENDSATGDAMTNDESVDFTLELSNFKFEPTMIQASAGETIRIKLVNTGGFHDFVIDELDVASEQINTGDETIVEVTIPANPSQDTYEFYCSIADHKELGMVGVLKIVE
jgi:plastocyanin